MPSLAEHVQVIRHAARRSAGRASAASGAALDRVRQWPLAGAAAASNSLTVTPPSPGSPTPLFAARAASAAAPKPCVHLGKGGGGRSRDVGRHAAGTRRRPARAGSAGNGLLPLDAAEVGVEREDLIGAAADERQRAEPAVADVAGHDQRGRQSVRLLRSDFRASPSKSTQSRAFRAPFWEIFASCPHPGRALRVAADGIPVARAASELGVRHAARRGAPLMSGESSSESSHR